VGAVLTPQFWLVAAQMFTVAQGRRLFGLIGAGGVVGGVVGAGTAALVLRALPVNALLPIATGVFLLAALLLSTIAADEGSPASSDPSAPARPPALLRGNPYLLRIAALVVLSTAALFQSSALCLYGDMFAARDLATTG